jgi:hypoxanthine phosphoribosyltransferase
MIETIKKTQWLDDEIIKQFVNGKTVLIVDEVDDTRTTLYHCVEELKKYSTPTKIIVSVIHNKLKLKRRVLTEDIIYIPGKETGDEWIVYPWDCK